MTIDEEIVFERKLADYYKDNHLKNEAREHEQRAEWFEELKCYKNDNDFSGYADRLHKIAFNSGYNKAIDDFSNILKENYDYLPQILLQEAFDRYIDKYGEQLKEGGKNE